MKTHIPLRALRPLAFALALAGMAASAQAPADVRVALVIGNSAYSGIPTLLNPANDATAMSGALRKLGFNVVELKDGTREQMAQAIETVRANLRGKQAVGMLYYAGHGLQLDWKNYMVPVDARLNAAADVPRQTVDIDSVINAFKTAGNRMNIIVLDACRDNPFSDKTSGKGLAQLDAPPGTFLAYATAPGNVAEDGEAQGNGLYTGYLVQELTKPAAKIEDVFKRVRLSVRKASNGRQIPWESTSLEDDFFFNDGQKYTFRLEDLQAIAAEARRKEDALKKAAEEARERERQIAMQIEQERLRAAEAAKRAEEERLAAVQRAKDLEQQAAQAREREKQEALKRDQERLAAQEREREAARVKAEAEARERERVLALQRDQERQRAEAAARLAEETRRAEEQRQAEIARSQAEAQAAAREKLSREEAQAREFATQKADWDRIKTSTKADDFFEFLRKYPSGLISEQAQFRLDQLQKAQVVATPGANGIKSLASGVSRFALGDEVVIDYIDGFTKNRNRLPPSVVTYADANRVEFNRGNLVVDQMGAVIRNRFGEKDPPLMVTPADLALGKKWRSAFINTRPDGVRESNYWDSKVVALEEITVPAGKFKVYRIERRGESVFTGGMTVLTGTIWVDPVTMLNVRQDILFRDRSGKIVEHSSTELVSYKRAPRPAS